MSRYDVEQNKYYFGVEYLQIDILKTKPRFHVEWK